MLRLATLVTLGLVRHRWTALRHAFPRAADQEPAFHPLDLARRAEMTCLDVYETFCAVSDTSRKAVALALHVTVLAHIDAQPEPLRREIEALLHERDSVPEAIRADVALLAHAVQSVPEIALEPLLRAEPGRFAGLQPQAQRFALALSVTDILRTGGPHPKPAPAPRRRAA